MRTKRALLTGLMLLAVTAAAAFVFVAWWRAVQAVFGVLVWLAVFTQP